MAARQNPFLEIPDQSPRLYIQCIGDDRELGNSVSLRTGLDYPAAVWLFRLLLPNELEGCVCRHWHSILLCRREPPLLHRRQQIFAYLLVWIKCETEIPRYAIGVHLEVEYARGLVFDLVIVRFRMSEFLENWSTRSVRELKHGSRQSPSGVALVEQPEIHFDCGHYSHRLAILHPRSELPPVHSLDGLFVQSEARTADDADLPWVSCWVND